MSINSERALHTVCQFLPTFMHKKCNFDSFQKVNIYSIPVFELRTQKWPNFDIMTELKVCIKTNFSHEIY